MTVVVSVVVAVVAMAVDVPLSVGRCHAPFWSYDHGGLSSSGCGGNGR